jgi:ABC-type Na+ transport system ATPase subunit NatA
MIEVEQLAKRFVHGHGKKARVVRAVDGVNWRANDGRITGLLGPNGAGKTTTLRMGGCVSTASMWSPSRWRRWPAWVCCPMRGACTRG